MTRYPTLLLATLTVACGAADRGAGSEDDLLTGELLNNAPIIGKPYVVQYAGDALWVVDAAGDPALHVIDPASGELLRSLGRRGRGPGELDGVDNIQADASGETAVWVFSNPRMDRFTVHDADRGRDGLRLDALPLAHRAVWLADDTGMAVSRSATEGIVHVLFDREGQVLHSSAGELLGPEDAPLDERVRATVSQFAVCVRPDGRKLAIAYADAGRITLYDHDLSARVQAAVPDASDATFENRPGTTGLRFRRQTMHYIGCAASERYLYALHSGRDFTADAVLESQHGDAVHVFDWDGKLVRTLRLTTDIRGVAVDPADRVLYGVSLLDAGVYRYALHRE